MCSPVLGAELDYSVGLQCWGLGWRAARLAYTIAKRSKPAARAEREGSLRCLCACPVSLPGLSGICLIHGIALWVDGMVDLDGFVHGLGIWWTNGDEVMCAPFAGRFNFLYVFVVVALSRRSSPWAELRSLLRTAGWRICQRWCLAIRYLTCFN